MVAGDADNHRRRGPEGTPAPGVVRPGDVTGVGFAGHERGAGRCREDVIARDGQQQVVRGAEAAAPGGFPRGACLGLCGLGGHRLPGLGSRWGSGG